MSKIDDYKQLTRKRLKDFLGLSDEEIEQLLIKYPIKSGVFTSRNPDLFGAVSANKKWVELYRCNLDGKAYWVGICIYTREFEILPSKYVETSNTYLRNPLDFQHFLKNTIKVEIKRTQASKPESIIEQALINLCAKFDFTYKAEYEINDLTGFSSGEWTGAPRFDFVVYDNQKNILFFIEFNGKQHYEDAYIYSNDVDLKLLQKRDMIKRGWAAANQIPVIDLSYGMYDSNNLIECLAAFITGMMYKSFRSKK